MASYSLSNSNQIPGTSWKGSTPGTRWARNNNWDTNHKYFSPPWYWRVVAFFGSSILLVGFLAVQPLYEKAPRLNVPKTTVSVLSIASLTLGWALTPLLCFAVRSPTFRNEAIFIPGLSSSLLGLVTLTLDFAFTTKYHWKLPATLGVAASAVSAIVYLTLVIITSIQISREKRRLGIHGSEFEASLLSSAAPIPHGSPTGSVYGTQQIRQAPSSSWSNDTTHHNDTWGSAPDWYDSRRRSSPQPTPTPHSVHASPSRMPAHLHRPQMPSPPPGAARGMSQRRSSSVYGQSALTHANKEAPVTTLRAPSPPVEEERMRQQMLRLLVNQTSEQALKNPSNQTFQIELPKEMRDVLMRVSVDNTSIRRAVEMPAESRGRGRVRAGSELKSKDDSIAYSSSSKTLAPTTDVKGPLASVKNMISPGVSSVQETPRSAYAKGQWKSREERRREIEMAPG